MVRKFGMSQHHCGIHVSFFSPKSVIAELARQCKKERCLYTLHLAAQGQMCKPAGVALNGVFL